MRILFVTPPLVQLNTAYAATPWLTGFARSLGHEARQCDLSLELALRIFSSEGIRGIREELLKRGAAETQSPAVGHFLRNFDRYVQVIDPVVAFLQGKDSSLAFRIVTRSFLPEGARFSQAEQADFNEDNFSWAFGTLGVQDRAKFFASLFLDDLADVVREGVDARFGFSRYAEKLAASEPSFEQLRGALAAPAPTLIDRWIDEISDAQLDRDRPELLAISVPFPGNVYGALRVARRARTRGISVALGGGYANTELRSLAEPRLFDEVDFVCLDDGEETLAGVFRYFEKGRDPRELIRTFWRDGDQVRWEPGTTGLDVSTVRPLPPVTYDGLPLDRYLSVLEMLNPMHRLWSDGKWLKLMVAHGCYWAKCSFCDTSLDYIRCYRPYDPEQIVDRMEQLVRETGCRGFHFTDEAAPPAALDKIAESLLRRGLSISWWANVRFEKAFTPKRVERLAASGCIAVSGGLEAASDRVLKFLSKGVTIEQAARVTKAFADSGILVHAYLMYGCPGETEQETVDSLEVVRQLFAAGCLHSAYWHRFSLTVHSPIGKEPEKYGLRPLAAKEAGPRFARNDLPFEDLKGCDHGAMRAGLEKALYNYMHGLDLDLPVQRWFERRVPKTTIRSDRVSRALAEE